MTMVAALSLSFFLRFIFNFNFVCVCVGVWSCSSECRCPQRTKRVLGPSELEFEAVVTVVSHLAWVLGTEVRSPVRAVPALNSCAIFPAPLLAHNPFISPSGEIHCYLEGKTSVPIKQGQTQSQGALLP